MAIWETWAGDSSTASSARKTPDCPTIPSSALRAYMQWAVTEVLSYSPREAVVPMGLAMPRGPYSGQEAAWASEMSRWRLVYEAVHLPDLVAGGDDHVETDVGWVGGLGGGGVPVEPGLLMVGVDRTA